MRKLAAHDRASDVVVTEEHLFYRVNRTNYPGQDDVFVQHDLTRGWEVSEQDYNQLHIAPRCYLIRRGKRSLFYPMGTAYAARFKTPSCDALAH
jgi:hypothetical protein